MFNQQVSVAKVIRIGNQHVQYRHNNVIENSGALYQLQYASHGPHHMLQVPILKLYFDPSKSSLNFYATF